MWNDDGTFLLKKKEKNKTINTKTAVILYTV